MINHLTLISCTNPCNSSTLVNNIKSYHSVNTCTLPGICRKFTWVMQFNYFDNSVKPAVLLSPFLKEDTGLESQQGHRAGKIPHFPCWSDSGTHDLNSYAVLSTD